jgi:phosphoenolpyruvate-protein kinase (PTS system EI component)
MAQAWADQVDFFAVGTNDLIASALGIDRDDPVVGSLNDPLHPGLLRTLHELVAAAHRSGRPVSVCGEMAADPEGAAVLAALRVDSLSVPVHQLRTVRRTLSGETPEALAHLAPQLVQVRTAGEARELLKNRSRSHPLQCTEPLTR